MHEDLIKSLKQIEGKECWSFIGGESTGSMMTLDFGKKTLRSFIISNPNLTTDQQRYDGEISLHIQFAAWRLESESAVICSSTSSNHKGGPKQIGLNQVVGRRVKSVAVMRPSLDLIIEFVGTLCLRVFCDQTNTEDECDNYSVHVGNTIYSVGIFSRIECESQDPA